MIHYFPSCNFTAANKPESEKIKQYLVEHTNVIVEGCCRPNHTKLTSEDTGLYVCETCAAIISEDSQGEAKSIFEYLDGIDFPWPDYHGEKMVIQDCFKARYRPNELNAIRNVMKKMNIEIIELPNSYEKADFCGTFYYGKMNPQNIKFAPKTFVKEADPKIIIKTPEEKEALMKEYCKQFDPNIKVVCYCNSCLRGLKMGGANAIHLMELTVRDL